MYVIILVDGTTKQFFFYTTRINNIFWEHDYLIRSNVL